MSGTDVSATPTTLVLMLIHPIHYLSEWFLWDADNRMCMDPVL